jgi:hypothetical protein
MKKFAMKKIGKTLVVVSLGAFIFALATANIGVTLLSMAGITYSTALVNEK